MNRRFTLLLVLGAITFPSSISARTVHVPEDHSTISEAMKGAESGDIVLVAPGTYKEKVKMKEGVSLRSAGDDTKGKIGLKRAEVTIIDGEGLERNGAGVVMARGSILDGFTVANVGKYDDAKWNKHYQTKGEEQSHEHIGAPGTPGIEIKGVTCSVINNIVHHIGYTGIAISSEKGKICSPHVFRNVCYRNMGGGIGSMMKSTGIIEENRCFENFYAGIGHDDASPTVINNTCYDNVRAGIGISEGACPIVRGNKCYKNRRAGIGTRTGANTRPIIEDNDCYENEMAGIGTEEEAAPIIRNNRCFKNKLAGIGSRTHATPTIVRNECYENLTAGIGQESDAKTVLVGNDVHDNRAAGIGFAACKEGRSTLMNNKVTNNALVAVGIQSGWAVTLSDNQLSRDGGMPPIVMVFENAEAIFTDNVIKGGGVAGIRVAGKIRAEDNKLIGTDLRRGGPPNFAIWGLPGSEIALQENKINGWRHGLHATKASVVATANIVREFHSTALVLKDCIADVYNNTAISTADSDQVLLMEGKKQGTVFNNRVLDSVERVEAN